MKSKFDQQINVITNDYFAESKKKLTLPELTKHSGSLSSLDGTNLFSAREKKVV